MPNILGIIPARYASQRFPGKPLADINGKTMIQHVFERASKAASLKKLVVATDNDAIHKNVEQFGGEVIMTSDKHQSGTERCNEVMQSLQYNFDIIINIQGDEPLIDPKQIDMVSGMFNSSKVEIATLAKIIKKEADLSDPNIVKITINKDNEALCFSRTIPNTNRNKEHHPFYKHIGIYAYRSDILSKITALKPTTTEKAENLEQLRWLDNGYKIKVGITQSETIAIDVPEDLKKLNLI